MSSERQPIVKIIPNPVDLPETADEGTLVILKEWIYLYRNGKWVRKPLKNYEN